MKLIGLAGDRGAGKDTVGEILAAWSFKRLAFADALRCEVAEAFSVPLHVFTDRELKDRENAALAFDRCRNREFVAAMQRAGFRLPIVRTPREALIRWGTEYRRAIDPDYWVARVASQIEHLRAMGHSRFVITDLRFRGEAHWIRSAGGQTWHVDRPGLRATRDHVSDVDLADWAFDHRIVNRRSLEWLARQVEAAVEQTKVAA